MATVVKISCSLGIVKKSKAFLVSVSPFFFFVRSCIRRWTSSYMRMTQAAHCAQRRRCPVFTFGSALDNLSTTALASISLSASAFVSRSVSRAVLPFASCRLLASVLTCAFVSALQSVLPSAWTFAYCRVFERLSKGALAYISASM